MNDLVTSTSSTKPALPKALTIRQFHAAIGGIIGLNTLYELAHCGRLKTIKIGMKNSKYLVPSSEVDNFFIREGELN